MKSDQGDVGDRYNAEDQQHDLQVTTIVAKATQPLHSCISILD